MFDPELNQVPEPNTVRIPEFIPVPVPQHAGGTRTR